MGRTCGLWALGRDGSAACSPGKQMSFSHHFLRSNTARRLSSVTVHGIAQHTLRSRCSESESLGPPDCNGSTSAADPSQRPAPCTDAGHPRAGLSFIFCVPTLVPVGRERGTTYLPPFLRTYTCAHVSAQAGHVSAMHELSQAMCQPSVCPARPCVSHVSAQPGHASA